MLQKDFKAVAKFTIMRHMQQYPNVCKLLEVDQCTPVSLVPCEHGFSFQNRIKTEAAASLSTESLSMLMILGLGTDVDCFDYAAAVSQ